MEINHAVYNIALSPDGETLGVACQSDAIQLWDLANLKAAIVRGHTQTAARVAFAPQGNRWASGSDDSTVVVWDAANNEELYTLKQHTMHVLGLAFSPDGKLLATGSDDFTVRLFDVATKRRVAILEGYGPIGKLVFAPDGKTIALSSKPGIVALWDTDEPRKVLQMQRLHTSWPDVSFSPDSKMLAGGGGDEGLVVLWETATGKILRELKGTGATNVAFSPSGATLAIGGRDGNVRLWDVARMQEKAVLKGHRDMIYASVYSRDGKRLYTGSLDATVKIWNVSRVER